MPGDTARRVSREPPLLNLGLAFASGGKRREYVGPQRRYLVAIMRFFMPDAEFARVGGLCCDHMVENPITIAPAATRPLA